MAKMSMARRYLRSAGIAHTNSIQIYSLTLGYKWVNDHLTKVGIQTCHRIATHERNLDKYSKRTRYEYCHEQILQYSSSSEFQNVLYLVDLERSKTEFIK